MRFYRILYLFSILFAALCTGCDDDLTDISRPEEHPAGCILLRLGTGCGMQTRTELKGSYPRHNVSSAYAIIYDGVGDNAVYVCHHNLHWSPVDEPEYGNGVIQQKDFEITVPSTITDGTYTILCVGLDNCSGDTYSLSMTDTSAPDFCREGATLAQAKAVLADGKSMKYSELFAGHANFTYSAGKVNTVSVEMRRRVAGIYAYLKDIPMAVNGKGVRYIRLVTGNNPTSEIGLVSKNATYASLPQDFGSGAQDDAAKTLDIIDLASIATPGTDNNYNINSEYTDTLGLLPNTLLLSSYIIPMATGEGNTFCVEILDDSQNVIKSFPALWNEAPENIEENKYPVCPDYIYHIGCRDNESERPMSLAGYRLEIDVIPWNELRVDTEFPDVPLYASFGYDKNPEFYIYDCINTTEKVSIFPSLLKKDWKLTIVAEDKDGLTDPATSCDWLYFKLPDGTYTQEIRSEDHPAEINKETGKVEKPAWKDRQIDIEILINDFVVRRDIKVAYNPNTPSGRKAINTDWRRARLVLQTDGSVATDTLQFRQYNAFTVGGEYDKNQSFDCAFSRFDADVVRDIDGNVKTAGHLSPWGYWNSTRGQIIVGDWNNSIYDYNGQKVYNDITKKEAIWGGDDQPKDQQVIVRYGRTEGYERDKNNEIINSLKNDEYFWYLPSQLELAYFFLDIALHQPDIDAHIEIGGLYWSCTPRAASYNSYCQKLLSEGNLWISHKDSKETRLQRTADAPGYTRRARKFK